MKRTGYKEMLRDRMPKMLNLALKWCKAKEKWLDYVYENHIKIVPKDQRGVEVKKCLGLKPKYNVNDMYPYLWEKGISYKQINDFIYSKSPQELSQILKMDFKDTIIWKDLDENETKFWNYVNSWVVWFKRTHMYIENTYKISRLVGKDERSIKIEIVQTYLRTMLPKEDASEEVKEKTYAYVDKLVDYLVNSFEKDT